MRRRSFNRPKEKLRGIKRRLNALDKWADSFEGYFPIDQQYEKHWNCKIPVLDRLVNLPTSNKIIQGHCVKAMFRAMFLLNQAKPAKLIDAKVTVLLTYPSLFESELCIFFDEDYFKNFYSRDNEDLSLSPLVNQSLMDELGVNLPKSIKETGFHCIINDEWDGENHQTIQEWWRYQL